MRVDLGKESEGWVVSGTMVAEFIIYSEDLKCGIRAFLNLKIFVYFKVIKANKY